MNDKMPGDKMVGDQEKEAFEIEQSIQRRFNVLEDEFDFNKLDDAWQARWYYVEMEVATGKDRKSALDHLEGFIKDLDKFFSRESEERE